MSSKLSLLILTLFAIILLAQAAPQFWGSMYNPNYYNYNPRGGYYGGGYHGGSHEHQ